MPEIRKFEIDMEKTVGWTWPFIAEDSDQDIEDLARRFAWIGELAKSSEWSMVGFHKFHLGRQSTCQNLGTEHRRYWIWQLSDEAVLLVSNRKGVDLQVIDGTPSERVLEILTEYFGKVGLRKAEKAA